MADDPSVYGSFMNYFLPQSARVGPNLPVPGLFDMLKGMGGGAQPGTPEEQQRRQQQQLAMAQQGLKMMQPQQTAVAAPAPIPVSAAPQQMAQPLPPASQVTPSTPANMQGGYPTTYGGLPGANAYAQRRAMPMPMPYPFGGVGAGGGYGR